MIIHLKVHGGILMVIHDHKKINISFCTYSKTTFFFTTERKKYIHVICIFCKLEKKYIRRKKPDLLFMVLEFLICKERRHRTRELIGAPDGVQLSLKLILDDRRLKSVFHHLWGLRFFTPCVFFYVYFPSIIGRFKLSSVSDSCLEFHS